ncbi:MAG: hypothetical protein D6734_11850, partial [Candidatus Schekmanbacteria bacterium]
GCQKVYKPKKNDKPNIILISVDTLRADHLMCYGYRYETSPFIDRFAMLGALFENAVTVVPSTMPSHISMLTSKIPRKHGIAHTGTIVKRGLLTLQKVVKGYGYKTAGFISSYVLSSDFNFNEGFDIFNDQLDKKTNLAQNKIIRDADKTTDAVINFLKKQGKNKPFFLFIHYFDPHWPYDPPQQYLHLYDTKYSGKLDGNFKTLQKMRLAMAKGKGVSENDRIHLQALYDGEIRFINDQFRRLIAELELSGLIQNTIIVFTADHGENFFEHDGYIDHSSRVYESNIHIPLIIFYRGIIPPNTKISKLIRNIDIAPTLLDLAGIEIPKEFEGKSFAGLLRGKEENKNKEIGEVVLFSEATRNALYPEGADEYLTKVKRKWTNDPFAKCIRTQRWKYIETPYLNRKELYDLSKDPQEVNNLANTLDEKTNKIIENLKVMLDKYTEINTSTGRMTKSKKSIENLKSLGYLQ